jgi:hypothetical protein
LNSVRLELVVAGKALIQQKDTFGLSRRDSSYKTEVKISVEANQEGSV